MRNKAYYLYGSLPNRFFFCNCHLTTDFFSKPSTSLEILKLEIFFIDLISYLWWIRGFYELIEIEDPGDFFHLFLVD